MNSENPSAQEAKNESPKPEQKNEELLRQGVQLLRFIGRAMVVVGEQIQKIDEQDIKRFSVQKIQDIFREKE